MPVPKKLLLFKPYEIKMGLKADLQNDIAVMLKEPWSERKGQVVPSDENIKLAGDALYLDAAVLMRTSPIQRFLWTPTSSHFQPRFINRSLDARRKSFAGKAAPLLHTTAVE
jgi:hypothetical protein